MPRGPNGERRPADVIGCAVMVGRIATGEIVELTKAPSGKVKSGRAGAAARKNALAPKQRRAIAKKAANARWGTATR